LLKNSHLAAILESPLRGVASLRLRGPFRGCDDPTIFEQPGFSTTSLHSGATNSGVNVKVLLRALRRQANARIILCNILPDCAVPDSLVQYLTKLRSARFPCAIFNQIEQRQILLCNI